MGFSEMSTESVNAISVSGRRRRSQADRHGHVHSHPEPHGEGREGLNPEDNEPTAPCVFLRVGAEQK